MKENKLSEIIGPNKLVRSFKKEGNTITDTVMIRPQVKTPPINDNVDKNAVELILKAATHAESYKKRTGMSNWANRATMNAVDEALIEKYGSISPSNAQKLYEDRHKALYDAQAAEVEYRREATKPPTPKKRNTTPIKCYFITAQDYFVGYDSYEGVVVIQRQFLTIPFRLLTKQVMPSSVTTIQNADGSFTRDDEKGYAFNNPTVEEFNNILKAKPSWDMLTKAYNTSVQHQLNNNLLERMDLTKAVVVL